MFVVWRAREKQRWYETRHTARLVESRRVDGKPRQRLVAVLGSYLQIGDPPKPVSVDERIRFWDWVIAVLDRLGLAADARRPIEAALAARVPPPTAAERHAAWAEGVQALRMALALGSPTPELMATLREHMANKP